MTILAFSLELAQDFIASEDKFPIDFDDAWQWLGYSRKERAFNKLKKSFEEGTDFYTKYCKTPTGGRPSVSVFITIDCFKSLGMMAGTEQGKLVRKYFLECEKKWELTKQVNPEFAQQIELLDKQKEVLAMQLRVRELDNTMLTLHGKQTVLVLRGYDQSIVEVEKPVLEVIDNRSGDRRQGMSFTMINDYYKQQTGNSFKNGAVIKKIIEKEAPGLIDMVQRPVNQDWVLVENVEKVLAILKNRNRQLLLGE